MPTPSAHTIRLRLPSAFAFAFAAAGLCGAESRAQDAKAGPPKLIHTIGAGEPFRVAISPDGTVLAYLSQTRTGNPTTATYRVGCWEIGPEGTKPKAAGGPSMSFKSFPIPMALAFRPDGKILALGTSRGDTRSPKESEQGGLTLWDVESGKRKARLISYPPFGPPPALGVAYSWHVGGIAWLGEGKTIAATGIGSARPADRVSDSVTLFDSTRGTQRATLHATEGGLSFLAANREGTLLAGTEHMAADRTCHLWDVARGRARWQFKGEKGADWVGLDFSHNGKSLATGSNNGNEGCIELIDVVKGKSLAKLQAKTTTVGGRMEIDRLMCLAAFPDRPWVVAGYRSGVLRIWDLDKHEVRFTLQDKEKLKITDEVKSVSVSRDGRRFASVHEDSICVWELGSFRP